MQSPVKCSAFYILFFHITFVLQEEEERGRKIHRRAHTQNIKIFSFLRGSAGQANT